MRNEILYLGRWQPLATEFYIAKYLSEYIPVRKAKFHDKNLDLNAKYILTALPTLAHSEFWESIKSIKIAHIFDLVRHTPREELYFDRLKHFDIVISPENVEYPFPHEYLQQGYDPEDYFPIKRTKIYDVGFIGHIYCSRRSQIKKLVKIVIRKNVYRERFSAFVNECKIMLAMPSWIDISGYWSDRVYLYLACGGFVLHHYVEGIEEEFEDGKHLAYYYSMQDLVEKINFYLKKDFLRDKIAEKGYERVKNFTWRERVKSLWQIISRL